jgi:hypothetical protein
LPAKQAELTGLSALVENNRGQCLCRMAKLSGGRAAYAGLLDARSAPRHSLAVVVGILVIAVCGRFCAAGTGQSRRSWWMKSDPTEEVTENRRSHLPTKRQYRIRRWRSTNGSSARHYELDGGSIATGS